MPNYQVGACQCLILLQCYLIPLAPGGLVLIHAGGSDNAVIPSYQLDFAIYCVSSDIPSPTDPGYLFLQINSDQLGCTKMEHSGSLFQASASYASKMNLTNTYALPLSLAFLLHQCELGLSTQRTSLISR